MLMTIATTIKTMGADPIFGQSDRFDKIFHMSKLQTRQSQLLGYFLHHALVFW